MGFLVRAVKPTGGDEDKAVGYFRSIDPSKGCERKYAGDVFEVEEEEFSNAHKPLVKNQIIRQGWMEKLSDYPTPSWIEKTFAEKKLEEMMALSQAQRPPGAPGQPVPQTSHEAAYRGGRR